MNNMLSDSTTYKSENNDPTSKIQTKLNSMINSWFKGKSIDIKFKNKLICLSGQAPYIYGLPNLHKQGIPLRPIVSTLNSPTYNLSKFLSNSISNILGKNYYFVKDSWDFCIKIPTNHVLISSFRYTQISQLT